MGCAQSHENNANGITADGVTRFAVVTDASFAEVGAVISFLGARPPCTLCNFIYLTT